MGGPKRYVSNSLFFLLRSDTSACPRAVSHIATLAGNIASTRLSKKSGQRSLPAHLSSLAKITVQTEAVCATSRRNNLSIAPEHRTSCVALHPQFSSGTVLPASRGKDPTSPRRVTSQLPVCVRVFGCTTWPACLAGLVAREPECRATLRRRGCGRQASGPIPQHFCLSDFDGQFADSVLLAGYNYSISNESRTKSARIFFAQGCEVEA